MSWSERAGKIFCFLCLLAGAYFIIKYALGVFLPFIIAWGLAIMTRPLAKKLSKRLKLPRKFCASALTILMLGSVVGVLYLVINRLIFEVEKLFIKLSENSERIGESIGHFFDRLSSIGDRKSPLLENLLKVEQFREFWENIDSIISNIISETISSLTQKIPSLIAGLIGRLPSFLIFLLITVISCFYFCSDIDRINRKAVSILPHKIQSKVPLIKKILVEKVSKYVRAYALLLAMTFGELWVGFSILRVPYPLLLAALVALLDILPIFGVGTVLIPYALIEILFAKDYYTGIGLFIVYVIITVVRQITEPKVVAGSLGLPPLLTLISMYAGLKLFGFFGIIIAPFFVLVICSLGEFSGSTKTLDTSQPI